MKVNRQEKQEAQQRQRRVVNEHWCNRCHCWVPPNEVEIQRGREEVHQGCGGRVVKVNSLVD